MIKSKIINIIKTRLGNRTDPGIDDLIANELELAQFQLENDPDFTPWFLLTENATYQMEPAEQRVPIPTDMIQEYEEGALFYGNTPLKKRDYDLLVEFFKDSTGLPQAYSLVNDYFVVFPIPDQNYEIRMTYYAKDSRITSLGDNDENQWLIYAPDWVVALAGAPVARYIKDAEAASMFIADAAVAKQRVYKIHIDRAERNAERLMGED